MCLVKELMLCRSHHSQTAKKKENFVSVWYDESNLRAFTFMSDDWII